MMSWIGNRIFKTVHSRNLVYNTCWEDPRVDRAALDLKQDSRVLVITSAGCNALDYLLAGAGEVVAVDMNPRQNYLLELKIAAARSLPWDEYFSLFGRGKLPDIDQHYRRSIRSCLSAPAQRYWNDRIKWFSGQGFWETFYFAGTTGYFARMINSYLDRRPDLRETLDCLLGGVSFNVQRQLYYDEIRPKFWTPFLRWLVGRNTTLALLGVPPAQRAQVERYYPGGITKFIEDSLDAVFGNLPLEDNYFWRVYLTGQYSPDCCPEYLTRQGYERIRNDLWTKLSIESTSIDNYLDREGEKFSHFVLLDHMDWLARHNEPGLQREWQGIFNRARPNARIIWRSGGLKVDYVDHLPVALRGRHERVGSCLKYLKDKAAELHAIDRVHTYGSFYIADLQAA